MNMRVIWNSWALVVLSATFAFPQQAREQRGANARAPQGQSSPVMLRGCIVSERNWIARAGSGTPGGGTLAATNAGDAPTGSAAAGSVSRGDHADDVVLIVTESRPDTSAAGAVPGSSPSPTDSGTVPSQTRAGKSSPAQSGVPTAFRLLLAPGATPAAYVGKRVEVNGRVKSTDERVATDASEVTRSGAATTGTRAEVAREPDAHPSADLPELTVQTITPIAGRCETP